MSVLTKEQIKQLAAEQQADVAKLELGRARKRERLLKQARQSQYSLFASGLGLAVAYVTTGISGAPFWSQVGMYALTMAVLIQGFGVHRRMDALLEFLEHDDES